MRVLQLIDSLDAGGAERMAVNLANALSEEVDDSYLCATREEGMLKGSIHASVNYLYLNKTATLDVKSIYKLYTYVTSEKISIIHAHSSSYFLGTIIKLLYPKVTLVWHDHYGNSELLANRPHHILRFCSRFFDMVFCVNTTLIQWSRTHLKTPHIQFLSNFVLPSTKANKITELKGYAGTRILCLANLRPQKDHLSLLQAFKKIYELHPDWSLHLVGKDFNDAYSSKIKAYIKEQHLEASVFLYGSKTDTEYIISQCEIGVLSSLSEGLPLSLIEYGFGGLAVVATDVGDCRRVIKDDSVGELVKAKDIEALNHCLVSYIEDVSIRNDVGTHLKTFVQHHFSKEGAIKVLMLNYKQLLSR